MANAAIAYLNLADSGTVSASSQQVTLPATNVQTPHVEERWRSSVSSAYLIVDLGSVQSIDTVLLRGITVGSSGTAQVRISATDPQVESALLHDSGALSSGSSSFDVAYDALVRLLSTPVSGRYVRIDLLDSAASYVEAGRLFVGLRTTFDRNFTFGWSIGWADRSVKSKTRGGQTLTWNDNSYRILDVNFDSVSSSQRYGIVESIDRLNGQRTDILFITDPDSTNLPRDSIWGLITDLSPVVQPQLVDIFGRQYKIEERL